MEWTDLSKNVRDAINMTPPKVASIADCHHCTDSCSLVFELNMQPKHVPREFWEFRSSWPVTAYRQWRQHVRAPEG